jgi:guanylate kinase
LVISAPSAAGKTTLGEALLGRFSNLQRVVTTTTRPQRQGEVDGESYHFVSDETFEDMKKRGEFFENATVHGYQYGNSKQAVEKILKSGRHCMLIIDVQGAQTIRGQHPHTFSIFIVPPSLEELESRLRNRNKETEAQVRVRLENARKEMAQKDSFDAVIVNDDFARARDELFHLVERVFTSRGT